MLLAESASDALRRWRKLLVGLFPPELGVSRPVDLSHAALSDGFEDLVGAEAGSGDEGHSCVLDKVGIEPESNSHSHSRKAPFPDLPDEIRHSSNMAYE